MIRSTFWLAVATVVMAPAFASATTVTIVSGRDNTIYRNNVNNSNQVCGCTPVRGKQAPLQ